MERQLSFIGVSERRKSKESPGKRGDSTLHLAARAGNLSRVREILQKCDGSEAKGLLSVQNQEGETPETDSNLAKIARNNGKTVLHSAARMGHLEVVHSLLINDPSSGLRTDKKGQTALHMAVKGQNVEIVMELLKPDPSVASLEDIFFVFDSLALFISLAVVVVQTSVVVIEQKAKQQLVFVINKLMWLACLAISVSFISLSYIVVGKQSRWLAIYTTTVGSVIMITTIGSMCYCVVVHRIEESKLRSIRKTESRSHSYPRSQASDQEILEGEYKRMYAL
ncbi:Ankyrin repeat-containing protein At5g02620 [Linum perenne]